MSCLALLPTPLEQLSLLGSPISDGGFEQSLEASRRKVEVFCDRVRKLDAHTALFFLVHFASAPRLQYLLRTSPAYRCTDWLDVIDKIVRQTLVDVTNVGVSESAWLQASLPTRFGGLGVRSVASLALPCYVSSMKSCLSLSSLICPAVGHVGGFVELGEALRSMRMLIVRDCELPSGNSEMSQRAWDDILSNQYFGSLMENANQIDRARLLAASAPHSGAWLQATPLPDLGLHLDDEAVRVNVALRLGAPMCEPHTCRCGAMVDRLGHHGLSCRYSAGRLPRHANLNDVVKRALAVAGIPSWLEPVGLDRGDGRRPDGVTVFPYSRGRALCWDATCTDTFSSASIIASAIERGSAAAAAEARKNDKYRNLMDRYLFEPLAVETMGVLGPSSVKFVGDLARRMRGVTGDNREKRWLFERLSLAVVRGNAAAILASARDLQP